MNWLVYCNFIVCFWPCWVLIAVHGPSPFVASRGYFQLWCTGFSWWLLLLPSMGSRLCGLQWFWCMGLVTPRYVESSWSRDQTHAPCIGKQILNHWTTREVPSFYILIHFPLFPVFQARKLQVISTVGQCWLPPGSFIPLSPCSHCPQVRYQDPPQSSLLTCRLVPASSVLPPKHPLHLGCPHSSHTYAHTGRSDLPTSVAPSSALLPGTLVFATLTYLGSPEQAMPSHSSTSPLWGAHPP